AEAVNYYLKQHPADLPAKTVLEAVEEMLVAKKNEGLSPRHIEDLDHRLKKFAADFECQLIGVTGGMVREWIQKRPDISNRTRNNFRLAVQTMFSFGKTRGYLPKDHNEMEAVPVWKTTEEA